MKLKYDDTDGQHAYWIDGRRAKGVTSIAKIPDDTYALQEWWKRKVVEGMARSPELVERAAAHFDDRHQLKLIAEDAARVAKAHEAAERGTATHKILERHDLGLEVIDTPYSRAVRHAWDVVLGAAGLDIVPEYIERVVVFPDQLICGTYDRLLRRRRDGKYVVADLKTGSVSYPHAMAIQLATYANAPWMAEKLPDGGGTTETFEKLPDVDKKWGVIVHMPTPETVELHKINIEAGWQAGRAIVFPTLKWRKRDDLLKPHGSVTVTDPDVPARDERVTWIRGRLQLVGMVDGAREIVAVRWPYKVPPRGPWSDLDIDALDVMLTSVETDMSAGFPVKDPALADITTI